MARRRDAAAAGHEGDWEKAVAALGDEDAGVRAAALGALVRLGRAGEAVVARALADPSPAVRRRAAEFARSLEQADFLPLLRDGDEGVVEAACFAVGEQGDVLAVAELCRIAGGHDDALCRESAVAALGAIGDAAGLPTVLSALQDRPAVRRRAVIALSAFEGPEVEERPPAGAAGPRLAGAAGGRGPAGPLRRPEAPQSAAGPRRTGVPIAGAGAPAPIARRARAAPSTATVVGESTRWTGMPVAVARRLAKPSSCALPPPGRDRG